MKIEIHDTTLPVAGINMDEIADLVEELLEKYGLGAKLIAQVKGDVVNGEVGYEIYKKIKGDCVDCVKRNMSMTGFYAKGRDSGVSWFIQIEPHPFERYSYPRAGCSPKIERTYELKVRVSGDVDQEILGKFYGITREIAQRIVEKNPSNIKVPDALRVARKYGTW